MPVAEAPTALITGLLDHRKFKTAWAPKPAQRSGQRPASPQVSVRRGTKDPPRERLDPEDVHQASPSESGTGRPQSPRPIRGLGGPSSTSCSCCGPLTAGPPPPSAVSLPVCFISSGHASCLAVCIALKVRRVRTLSRDPACQALCWGLYFVFSFKTEALLSPPSWMGAESREPGRQSPAS